MAWRKKSIGSEQSVGKNSPDDIRNHPTPLIDRAGQFIHRNRVASAAVGLVLISLIGAVIASTWLAHRAKLAEAQSEDSPSEGRQLTQLRRVNYYDRLSDRPDATRISESRMKDALTPVVRRDLADANNSAESAMDGYRNVSFRTTAPAEDQVVADNPTDRPTRQTLILSYPNPQGVILRSEVDHARLNFTIGDYLALTNKPQEALAAFQNQVAIDEKSVAADPGNVQLQTNLAYSSSRIGDLLTEQGDQAGALPYYQRAVDIYTNTKNAAVGPQDVATSLELGRLLGKLAQTHARLGYTDKAIAEANKAVDLLEALPVDTANVKQSHTRALAYGEIGDAFSLLAGDTRTPQELMKQLWSAARDMYERSLHILWGLRDQGVLNADGLTEIDTISQKIAECDVFLAK